MKVAWGLGYQVKRHSRTSLSRRLQVSFVARIAIIATGSLAQLCSKLRVADLNFRRQDLRACRPCHIFCTNGMHHLISHPLVLFCFAGRFSGAWMEEGRPHAWPPSVNAAWCYNIDTYGCYIMGRVSSISINAAFAACCFRHFQNTIISERIISSFFILGTRIPRWRDAVSPRSWLI